MFSGCFDTSGSMIPLPGRSILSLDGFCDEEQQKEWGILVVGLEDFTGYAPRCNNLLFQHLDHNPTM